MSVIPSTLYTQYQERVGNGTLPQCARSETPYCLPQQVLDSLDFARNCTLLGEYGVAALDLSVPDDVRAALYAKIWNETLPADLYNNTLLVPYMLQCNIGISGTEWLFYPFELDPCLQESWRICLPQVCDHQLGSTGNPDITGVGMLLSYTFTILFVTISFSEHLQKGRGLPETLIARHRLAMNRSSELFLDTQIFLSVAICIAVFPELCQSPNRYEVDLLLHITLFSAFTLLTLASLKISNLRRKRWRKFMVTISCLLAPVFYLLIYWLPGSGSDTDIAWYSLCTPYGNRILYWKFIIFEGVLSGLMLLCICVYSLLSFTQLWERSSRYKHWKVFRLLPWIRSLSIRFEILTISTCICLTISWILYIFLMYERFSEEAISGPEFVENRVTFGQVMAALTWLGPLVDYLYLLKYGEQEGLEGKLPLGMSATKTIPRSDTVQDTLEENFGEHVSLVSVGGSHREEGDMENLSARERLATW